MLFAKIVHREAELLDGGDDDLVGVVLGEQTAHEGGGVVLEKSGSLEGGERLAAAGGVPDDGESLK